VYEEGLSEALEDLSALLGREDEVGILLNVFDELRLILRHTEEVRRLTNKQTTNSCEAI